MFASIPLLVLLTTLELAVRVFALDQELPEQYSEELRSGLAIPILGFKLKPDLMPAGQPLNRAGFRSREFDAEARGRASHPRARRLVHVRPPLRTESTFYYIPEPYPQLLERVAAERLGSGRSRC